MCKEEQEEEKEAPLQRPQEWWYDCCCVSIMSFQGFTLETQNKPPQFLEGVLIPSSERINMNMWIKMVQSGNGDGYLLWHVCVHVGRVELEH